MRIAIIGSGISGLTAAHLLHRDFDIQIFEANDYIGGHTHTIPVQTDSGSYMVDTGFIVLNDRTYPVLNSWTESTATIAWKPRRSSSTREGS